MIEFRNHTRIERMILHELLLREDWEVVSLSRLADDLGIHYGNARQATTRLEEEGWLRREKLRGRDWLLSLRGPFDNQVGHNDSPSRGSVSTKYFHMTHDTQKDDSMGSIISSLRATINAQEEYKRPELSGEEKERLAVTARKLANIKDDRLRLAYYMAVCIENARLLKEVNEHRAARGFPPLTVFENGAEK